VAFDVTSRKEIEARSRENQAQIEVHHRLMSQREQERRKIAQDLHDGPLQELIALTFLCSAAIDSAEDPQMIAQLEAIRDNLKERIGELRAFASELRPPALERFGLDKAIDSHLDSFKRKYPEIEIHMEAQTRNLIPPEGVGVALYRIYQESLNNIVRHAQATGVTVLVGEHDRHITLEIRDNGQGFQLPEQWLDLARQGHLGLVGIHERAEALGGTAQVYSNPGEGTVIKVEIPI
jgi:signal transduction histidine kinase